jgi:hypothetical protein
MYLNQICLKTGIRVLQTMENGVHVQARFQLGSAYKYTQSRVQIFPPEYLDSYTI